MSPFVSIVRFVLPAALALAAGCAGYSWRPSVPSEARSVAVPTFANESAVTELGAVVTRQVLREFQREGTYRLAAVGDGALEVQGRVKSGHSHVVAYERSTGLRNREHRFTVVAEVSFIDKKSGKVLVNDRTYRASTTFLAANDVMSGERDASGRIGEELARQIVDDALALKWETE